MTDEIDYKAKYEKIQKEFSELKLLVSYGFCIDDSISKVYSTKDFIESMVFKADVCECFNCRKCDFVCDCDPEEEKLNKIDKVINDFNESSKEIARTYLDSGILKFCFNFSPCIEIKTKDPYIIKGVKQILSEGDSSLAEDVLNGYDPFMIHLGISVLDCGKNIHEIENISAGDEVYYICYEEAKIIYGSYIEMYNELVIV